MPSIPGITAADRFPAGCVDCHIDMPHINQDERLSTIISGWSKNGISSDLLEQARQVARADYRVEGRHPNSADIYRNIPATCIDCHQQGSGSGVPFAPLMHLVHLSVR